MPKILTFANCFAEEIEDTLDSVDDDNESYIPDEEEDDDESLEIDNVDDDSDDDDHGLDLDPDVNDDASHDNIQPHGVSNEGEPNDIDADDPAPDDGNFPLDEEGPPELEPDDYNSGEEDDDDMGDPPLMETINKEDEDTDESNGNEGVSDIPKHLGVNDNESENEGAGGATSGKQGASDDDSDDEGLTESEAFERAASHGATAADSSATGRPKCKVRSKMKMMDDDIYEYINTNVHAIFEDMDTELMFTLMSGDDVGDMLSFIMAQMSVKAGIKQFRKKGEEAIMLELEQLLYHKVMQGHDAKTLTKQQKKAALKYLMFLKEKRCGKIKGRGCADGWKQRLYKTKDETSSPMITIESLFLTCLIDAMEERCVITCDIPGAFMQMDIDELIHVKLEGELAELLV